MDLKNEVERIREHYHRYDRNPEISTRWAPFSEDEVDHRNQQYHALATLFRRTGRMSLADLKILDLGCGRGRVVRACLDLGASPESVVGVDLQADRIEEARRLSPHLDFRVGSGTDLDFPDEEFDLVFQFVVFSSVFSAELRRHLAKEMLRVLRPGGYIFWWDGTTTNQGKLAEQLQPELLFPGVPCSSLGYALRPKPSYGLRLPGILRRMGLGRLADRWGYPASHIAALIGPKPSVG